MGLFLRRRGVRIDSPGSRLWAGYMGTKKQLGILQVYVGLAGTAFDSWCHSLALAVNTLLLEGMV